MTVNNFSYSATSNSASNSNLGTKMPTITREAVSDHLLIRGAEAFDELGLSVIPQEWIDYGLIIVNNQINPKNAPIGKVLLESLEEIGIAIKVVTLRACEDNNKDVEVFFGDDDIILGSGQGKHIVGKIAADGIDENPFPGATLRDLETMPIYGMDIPKTILIGGVETELFKGVGNAYDAMATHVADSIQSLDLEDQVELATALARGGVKHNRNKKDHEAHVITVVPQSRKARSYGEATFKFHSRNKCQVTTGRDRWANATMDLNGKIYDASTMVVILLMSMTSERLVTQRQIDGWLSSLSSMWTREDNYGIKLEPNDVLSFVIANSHKTLKAVACLADDKQRYPHFALANEKFNNKVMNEYLGNGVPVITDKYGTERLIKEQGARAMMVDVMTVAEARAELSGFEAWAKGQAIEEDSHVVIMPYDADKEGKVLNRPNNAMTGTSSSSWSTQHPIVPTALRMYTGENSPNAVFRGLEIEGIICDSLFNNGSGVASARPGFVRSIAVGKSLSGDLHSFQFPPAWQLFLRQSAAAHKNADWLGEFIPTIEKKCKELIGKEFSYGDDVLTFWDSDPAFKRTIINMMDYNQNVRVTGYSITRLGTSDTINVTLNVDMEYLGNQIKWRGPGVKCTTLIEQIYFSDEEYNETYEILFPYEALKGRLAQVYMYANAMADLGFTSLYKRGKVYLTDTETGEVIVSDLSSTVSHFETWVKDNVRLVTITRSVEKSHYQRVLDSNNGVLPHVKIVGETDDDFGKDGSSGGYVIEEEVQCLAGKMHYQCEVSTALESTSTQSVLLETIACISIIDLMSGRANADDNLGTLLWKDSTDYRQGILDAISMVSGAPEGTPVLTIDDYEVFGTLRIGAKGEMLTGRDLLRAFSKEYPTGFTVRTTGDDGIKDTFILAKAFMSLASFGTGGSGSGVALDVAELLHYMASPPDGGRISGFESAIHGLNSRVKAGLESWMGLGKRTGTLNSKSILKRLGRTKKLQISGKIQTSHNPFMAAHYFTVDGEDFSLPMVVFHPDCDMVALGGIKAGDVIALSRTPMVSPVWCHVKISAKYGLIGYATTLPETWAEGNEGDADGDGCTYFTMPKVITYYWAAQFNKSILSQGGYKYVYGAPSNQPFKDFVSLDDAWGKKLLCADQSLIPQAIWDHYDGKIKAVKPVLVFNTNNFLLSTVENVSNHYSRWVGTAYGGCSILSFKAAELAFKLYAGILGTAMMTIPQGGLGLDLAASHLVAREVLSGDISSLTAGQEANVVPVYNMMVKHVEACVMSWRYGYEGMGLAGYSASATGFFNAISTATNPFNKLKYMVKDVSAMVGDKLVISTEIPSDASQAVPISTFLQNYFPLFANKDPLVGQIVAEAEYLRRLYRKVERDGLESTNAKEVAEAMTWCALRRTTQGDPNVSFLDAYEEDGATSGFAAVEILNLTLVHPVLDNCMQVATDAHKDISLAMIKAHEDRMSY